MRWLLVVALLVACKGKEKPEMTKSLHMENVSARERQDYKFDAVCIKAIDAAAAAPLNARPKLLVDNCQVCAGWNTILTWNLEGTKPEDLQKALEGCGAFCNSDAKMKFMASANKAKGSSNDIAWRRLADACGDRIDASTDHRFMSAPYFALGRIGKAATADGLAKLDGITLPLPALTVAGTGLALPVLDDNVASEVGDLAVTIIGDTIHVGRLPRAKIVKAGVLVELGDPPYPSKAVKLADLPASLTDKTQKVILLAPHAMPAAKLIPIVAAIGSVAPLYLGVAAVESPAGWQLPAAVPYALQIGKAGIKVTSEMTVQNLAAELVAKRSGTLTAP